MVAEESPAAALRAWRQKRGWNQADLAEALATTQSHISRIENGQALPDLVLSLRIAKRCRISAGRWATPLVQRTGTEG